MIQLHGKGLPSSWALQSLQESDKSTVSLHLHPAKKKVHNNFVCNFTGLKHSHKLGFLNCWGFQHIPCFTFFKNKIILTIIILINFKNVSSFYRHKQVIFQEANTVYFKSQTATVPIPALSLTIYVSVASYIANLCLSFIYEMRITGPR